LRRQQCGTVANARVFICVSRQAPEEPTYPGSKHKPTTSITSSIMRQHVRLPSTHSSGSRAEDPSAIVASTPAQATRVSSAGARSFINDSEAAVAIYGIAYVSSAKGIGAAFHRLTFGCHDMGGHTHITWHSVV